MQFKNPDLDFIIHNAPIECQFLGFISDTLTLQREGWQLAVYENPETSTLQVALWNKKYEVYGISKKIENFNSFDIRRGSSEKPVLEFTLSKEINLYTEVKLSSENFNSMNVEPFATSLRTTISRYSDRWFKDVPDETVELSEEQINELKPKMTRKLKI